MIRVLIAKPGLDGHDKGAKMVALALKERGMEVIYTGLHRTVGDIVKAAEQEDADVIGLSILSGAHVPICRRLMKALADRGGRKRTVIVGGVIPERDRAALNGLGVDGVFPTGAPFDDIARFIRERHGG